MTNTYLCHHLRDLIGRKRGRGRRRGTERLQLAHLETIWKSGGTFYQDTQLLRDGATSESTSNLHHIILWLSTCKSWIKSKSESTVLFSDKHIKGDYQQNAGGSLRTILHSKFFFKERGEWQSDNRIGSPRPAFPHGDRNSTTYRPIPFRANSETS